PAAKVCWGVKLGVAAPVGVVFRYTDTTSEPPLPTHRSGLPSSLKSPTAIVLGTTLAPKVTWGGKLTVADPVGVVFSGTESGFGPGWATRRSGWRSPLKSATATAWASPTTAKVCWGAKLGMAAPVGVMFSSTPTVAELPPLATATSSLPSPLKSPTAVVTGR